MAVKTIAFMLPWVDPLSANSNLYNAGLIARIETSIADRAITAGKALEINANIFDQQLNTTDSPTFAGLTLGNVPFSGLVTDPGGDRIVFWDDSASQMAFLSLGTSLAFNGTTLELDGIEPGATADQTGSEIKALYEAEADTNAFTDADRTKLDGIEASADVTDAANVDAAGAVMDSDFIGNGHMVRTASGAYASRSVAGGTGVSVANGDGVSGNPTVSIGQDVAPTANVTFNNVAVTGTVDGRDVAVDGTKLDGIESGATTDQTGAEIKALYEAEADTNAFTDADHTKLDGLNIGSTVQAYDANLTSHLSTFTLPVADGASGQVMTTDGAGNITFSTPAGSGDALKAANEYITGAWEFFNNMQVTEGAVRWLYQTGNAAAHSDSNHGSIGIGVTDGGAINGVRVVNHDDPDNPIYNSQTVIFSTGKGGVSVGNDWFEIDPSGRFTGDASTTFPADLPARSIYSPAVISDSRDVDVDAYGAVSDGEWYDGVASITSGTAILTLSGGTTFPSDIAGKLIAVRNAGAGDATPGSSDVSTLYATVLTRDSSTQVTLDTNAGATVSNERVAWYTDNSTAFTNALAAIPTWGGRLILKGHGYHAPSLTFANKNALEILGRRSTLLNHIGNSATTFAHVQASCNEVGIEDVTFAGIGATRVRTNGRYQQIGLRFDASNSELRNVSAWGNSNFGIFVGQDTSNLTSNVHMYGGKSYENVGDGWHFGRVDGIHARDLHARDNGDDNFGIIGYETSSHACKNMTFDGCTATGGDYRGFAIKHAEDVVLTSCTAKDCNGAGLEINAFASGAQTGFDTHFSDNIRVKDLTVKDCSKLYSSAGVGIYHVNNVELENLSVKDSGTAGGNESSNIIIFNVLNCYIRGGQNGMSRGGGGQGIFYWNQTSFEGRNHRFIEATYDSPDAASTEQISINDVDFRMEVSVAGRYDIWLLPDAGSAGGQNNKIDKLAAVTITGNRSGSYKGDQVGINQAVIKVNPDKVDFLDVGQTDVRNSADTGTETVNSNRNVFGHGIDLS